MGMAVLMHETVKKPLWRNLICFAFLADPSIALIAVAVVDIWQWGCFSPCSL